MSYPADLFVPAHTFALEPGGLVFDEELYSLAVQVEEDHDKDIWLLRLEGELQFATQYPGAHRKCCTLNPKYRLSAKVSGKPQVVHQSYRVGQLVSVKGLPPLVVSQVIRGATLAYSLSGEQRDLRSGEAVVWSSWELWITDSEERAVSDTPFMQFTVRQP
ncbi:TPA: hypothetical protein UN269_000573 [Stenotrophomonas maltophilia]|nr:hypothetical protein [Stenotrophomonas maltophilia]